MRQTTFTLLFFALMTLISCKKDKYDVTINQYDDDQIKAYMTTNNISGLTRDTSGMYYKIITPGAGSAIQYSDNISVVYSVRSLDGKYESIDTIANHFQDFAGHIASSGYPLGFGTKGVQQAIHDLLNKKGGSMRLIIPSRLAYGVSGIGSGSSSVTTGRIAGNQCLDLYIHIIDNQAAYDKASIKSFIANNNLSTTLLEDPDGYYYNIRTPGTGTVAITNNSSIAVTYTVRLLNGTVVDEYNAAGGNVLEIPDLIEGVQQGLKKYATAGSLITFVIPSAKAYGPTGPTGIPPNSVIRFEVQVLSVAP
jgi:FKBP-type peptidyl-prolyl cis-trans isomerase FkpA